MTNDNNIRTEYEDSAAEVALAEQRLRVADCNDAIAWQELADALAAAEARHDRATDALDNDAKDGL